MYSIPDNYTIFTKRETEQQAELDKLPKCLGCGEPVQQSDALYINGGYICDGCLEDLRREVLPEL